MAQKLSKTNSDTVVSAVRKRSIVQRILRKTKVRNRLVLAFLFLSIFPLLFLGGVSYRNSYNDVEQISSEYSSKITYQVADNINYILSEYEENFKLIALNSSILSDIYDYRKETDEYSRIDINNRINLQLSTIVGMDKGIDSVELCSVYGDRFYYYVPIIQNDYINSELVKKAINNNGIIWNLSRKELQTDAEPFIILGRNLKIQFSNEIIGYAFMSIKRDFVEKLCRDNSEGNKQYLLVTDEKGHIISHPDVSMVLKKYDQDILDKINNMEKEKKIDSSVKNYFKINTKDGMLFVSYNIVDKTQWKVINVALHSELMKSTLNNGVLTLIVAFVCVIVALVLALIVTKSITDPINKLVLIMKKVGKGDLTVEIEHSPGDTRDEYGMLLLGFNDMISKLNTSMNDVYNSKIKEKELEYLRTESELNALQQQINPHFLYNILESIYWTLQSKGDKETSKMISVLGNFFRSSISKGREYIFIEEELNNVENYVKLQKIRFGERLTVKWEIDENIIKKYRTIKLILQPIVENAIVHGLEKIAQGGTIIVKCYKNGESIVFECLDDGLGMTEEEVNNLQNYINSPEKKPEDSIGVKNVNQRIKICFGEEYGVWIESEIGKGTNVHLIIPLLQ